MPAAEKPPSDALAAKAREVHARLAVVYGTPVPFFHHHDALSEIVSALLSHRTRNSASGAAFKALKARYPTWEQVRDAEPAEVQATIAGVTWPELKAPRIQEVLRRVTADRGELSLDFLRDMTVPGARAWLESLPGVGPKTSAATLLFSELRMPALPVDSHHHRVALRLALIPAKCSLDQAHKRLAALLPADSSAQEVYDDHELLMFHGQRCCFPAKPACQRCTLFDLCPTGQSLHPPAPHEPAS